MTVLWICNAFVIKKFLIRYKKIEKIKLDYLVIIIFIITLIFSSVVRFDFTGQIDTSVGKKQIENETLVYPFLADEWNVGTFVKRAIEENKLAFEHPYIEGRSIVNMMFSFYTVVSGIFLVLGLDVFTNYGFLTIFFTSIVSSLVYLFLVSNGIRKSIAFFLGLSIIFVDNSGTLPGFWTFIPYNLGLIFYIVHLIGISYKKTRLVLFSGLLSFLFYPPMLIFITLSTFFYFYLGDFKEEYRNKLFKKIFKWGGIFLLFLVVLISVATSFTITDVIERILKLSIRITGLPYGTDPYMPIWHIIPFFILPFALVGFYKTFREKNWLFAPTLLALFYWLIYWNYEFVIFIGSPRVAIILSILLIICSGFAFQSFYNWLNKKYSFTRSSKFDLFLIILAIAVSFSLLPTYTSNDDWKKYVFLQMATNPGGERLKIMPISPANQYVTEEDIEIFENLEEGTFMSTPWKALTIASITGHKPLSTKAATYWVYKLRYKDFNIMDCDEKKQRAETYGLDYVYSSREILCADSFEEIKRSQEGFILYKYISEK
jgi:hypothetical protein